MRILTDCIMLGFLGCCSYSDWKKRSIPVWLLSMYSVAAVLLTIFCSENGIGISVAGAGIGAVFFLVSFLTKESIGYGDSWLITILGLYLGGERLLWLLFVAAFLAGVVSLFQMWRKGWKREGTLPFVPFLAVAFVGVMLSCI